MKANLSKILVILILFSLLVIGASANKAEPSKTVILALENDPYYSLAKEISETENLLIYSTLKEALRQNPVFLLWVVSPQQLSEAALVKVGKELNSYGNSVSIGLITGKSLDDAHRVWQGSSKVKYSKYSIINGSKGNKVSPEIVYNYQAKNTVIELNKDNLMYELKTSDIIQISLEGSAGSWFEKSSKLNIKSKDIPKLKSGVILNNGCSTFRPWEPNSIAFECINKGIVAYCGFVFPSVTGTRFADYYSIAALNTWSECPLGHFVQVQNNAAMQSYSSISHFYMIGDPRIYCRSEPPYRLASDEADNNTRLIVLKDVELGIIPIHIKDSYQYKYAVVNNTYADMSKEYFSKQVQIININKDKYIYYNNKNQKSISIKLYKKKPYIMSGISYIINLGDLVIVNNQNKGLFIPLSIIFIILVTIGIYRKRVNSSQLLRALIVGGLVAIFVYLYSYLRINKIQVTNIPIKISWSYVFYSFVSSGYGLLLYQNSMSIKGKLKAVLVANINYFIAIVMFIFIKIVNVTVLYDKFSIYRFSYPWLFTLFVFLISSILYLMIYSISNKIALRYSKN